MGYRYSYCHSLLERDFHDDVDRDCRAIPKCRCKLPRQEIPNRRLIRWVYRTAQNQHGVHQPTR